MKKTIFILMAAAMFSMFTACNSCTQEKKSNEVSVENLVPENTISTDRQQMFLNYGGDYRWYETTARFENFFDAEATREIAEVVNVFQAVVSRDEKSFDTYVVQFKHTLDGSIEGVVHDFWIGDSPLNEEKIVLTFEQALERLYQANIVKPHSRYCVLRKEVGPKDANPQYIFGNIHEQVYVDAVTGAVSSENPVFAGLNLGTPLGEWP